MQEERYVAVVDFGSSKVSLCVSSVKDGAPDQILFFKNLPSEGIVRGNILNPQKVAAPLRSLVSEAQAQTGLHITLAVVNLPRWNVRTQNISHRMDDRDPSAYITQTDIHSLSEFAYSELNHRIDTKTDIIYGILPQSYSTEDMLQVSEDDVIGATSSFLEGHFIAFTGAKRYKDNIDRVLSDVGLSAADYVFSPVCESENVITEEEKDRGAALVEIGAEVTSVSVYHKGALRYYGAFPFGGKVVTSDIHTECNIPDKLAENLKLAYGFCTPDRLQTLSDKTIKIDNPASSESQQLTVKYLAEIIYCRMNEILNAVMHLIGESGLDNNLRAGIILSGGGSLIHCCCSLVSSMTGLPCRIAYPALFRSPKENALEGLLLNAAYNEYLNCAVPATEEEKKEQEKKAEEKEEEEPILVAPTIEPEPVQKPKPAAKPAAQPKKKREGFFSTWGNKVGHGFKQMTSQVGDIFDGFYDSATDDNTNK